MKKNNLLFSAISFLSVVGFFSCAKNDNYLYHTRPEAAELGVRSGKVNIKELAGNPNVDIVWVIDNSGSMGEEQKAIIDNTSNFIERFSIRPYIRWKFGILSSDISNLKTYQSGFDPKSEIAWNSVDPVKRFKEGVKKLGTNGDGYERFFEPVVESFAEYPTFLRPNSLLIVILVTDAKEQSSMTSKEFLSEMATIKSSELFHVYGVFSAKDLGCSANELDESNVTYSGSKFEDVINATKGKYFALCADGFGENLVGIADDIVKLLQNPRILLKKRPLVNTIKVFYKDQELPGGAKENGAIWTYDYEMNAIVFHTLDFAPEQDAQVEVVYDEDNGWN